MNRNLFHICCLFLLSTACTHSPATEDTGTSTENYQISEIAIRTMGEDGQIKNFEGDGSWNYLEDFVVQVQVKSESGEAFHENRKLELALYNSEEEKIWSDTKNVSYIPAEGKYVSWIISSTDDTPVNCIGPFRAEATLSGQTPIASAHTFHDAQCGE